MVAVYCRCKVAASLPMGLAIRSGPEQWPATHHDLADDLADQVAQAWEKGSVTPLDEPRAAYAGRDPGAGTGQDRLVA
jgi:hypothetical protein